MARQSGEAPVRPPDVDIETRRVPPMDLNAAALIDKRTRRIDGAEACLFLLTRASDELVLAHATAAPLRDAAAALQIPVGQGLSGWVAANRSTIRNADPSLDLKDASARLGLRWCTSTPVFAHGDLVGALTVFLARMHRFTEAEGWMVGTLGQEIGLMLAHAEASHCAEARLSLASARGIAAVS
jgi:signal transduction protein with GAF and PtsI domain